VRAPEELDKTRHNAALDYAFDWGIAFLGKQLAEFGRRIKLLIYTIREHTLNHLRKLLGEL
jgi:hypothetical protein